MKVSLRRLGMPDTSVTDALIKQGIRKDDNEAIRRLWYAGEGPTLEEHERNKYNDSPDTHTAHRHRHLRVPCQRYARDPKGRLRAIGCAPTTSVYKQESEQFLPENGPATK